jgi:hypothetical protein
MKSGFYKNLTCLVFVFIGFSCTPMQNVTVSSVDNANALQNSSFLYALPQTVLDITVIAEEINIIPGPYEKFAEKYLGIQHVPAKSEKVYNLLNIKMDMHLEADPDYLFSIQGVGDPGKIEGLAGLLKDSLILSAKNFSENHIYGFAFAPKSIETPYTDLSVKRNFEAEKDVEVSMVMPDTLYSSRSSSRLKEKTLEQKAEEAANFLIKLKKRRFKLIAGQYDTMPGGEAMSEALKELSRIEQEYLSLFIGKRVVNQIYKVYHYTPVAVKKGAPVILFRFSPSEGFTDARETVGTPVFLEITPLRKTKDLEDFRLPVKPVTNLIPYRIPDQVNIKLFAGEQIWTEAMIPVFQYGANITKNNTR